MHDMLLDASLVFERALESPPDRLVLNDGEHWSQKFYDPDRNKYDWDDPEWKAQNEKSPHGFYPIYLTQGYFMIVSKRDYKRMTTYPDGRPKKWYATVRRDSETGDVFEVYAGRRGRKDETITVGAHREVLRCINTNGDVDHVNGYGLDNRNYAKESVNLILGSTTLNMRNTNQTRRVHTGLMRGVEKRGVNKEGQQRYGGIRARRLGKHRVRVFRSKRTWLTQEPANRWYLNQIKRLSGGRIAWSHNPGTVHYPVFPPLMESEPSAKSHKLRQKAVARERVLADANIPF